MRVNCRLKELGERKVREFTDKTNVRHSFDYIMARFEAVRPVVEDEGEPEEPLDGRPEPVDMFWAELRGTNCYLAPHLRPEVEYTLEGHWRGSKYDSETSGATFYHNDLIVDEIRPSQEWAESEK